MSQHHNVTAGIDIGDRYSHLCLLDTDSGEVIEEGRIPTNHSAFEKRFSDSKPMRIAIETGTHSPWISRLTARGVRPRDPGCQRQEAEAHLRRG